MPLSSYCLYFMPEILSFFLVTVLTAVIVRGRGPPRGTAALAAGAVLGTLLGTKPHAVAVAAALTVFLVVEHCRSAGIPRGVAAACRSLALACLGAVLTYAAGTWLYHGSRPPAAGDMTGRVYHGFIVDGFAGRFSPATLLAILGRHLALNLSVLAVPLLRGRADYTKGNRFLHAAALGSMPPARRIGNLALSFFAKIASGYWNIFDPTNGYTAIHAEALSLLDTSRLGKRYFFETSMLVELGIAGAVVQDVPMPARYGDEQSSLSITKTLWEFPPKLLRGWLRRTWSQHFLRDFTPLALLLSAGLVMVTAGSAWGLAWWWRSWRTGIPASTGTVMLAVLPLILGVQCLLQALVLDLQAVPRAPIQRRTRPRDSHASGAGRIRPGDLPPLHHAVVPQRHVRWPQDPEGGGGAGPRPTGPRPATCRMITPPAAFPGSKASIRAAIRDVLAEADRLDEATFPAVPCVWLRPPETPDAPLFPAANRACGNAAFPVSTPL